MFCSTRDSGLWMDAAREVLRVEPERAREIFLRMARTLSGDELASFMSGAATWPIRMKLVFGLPKWRSSKQPDWCFGTASHPSRVRWWISEPIVRNAFIDLVALGAVVLIGLPHGALDGAIAFRLGLLDDSRSLFRFITVYLSAGLAVVLFWFAMPAVALCVFLAVSLIHLGWETRNGDGIELEVLAHGGLVIAGISQFHAARWM